MSKVANSSPVTIEPERTDSLKKYKTTSTAELSGMDTEKILSTHIPDLVQVYGGFRGRTLSSAK